MTNTTHLEIDQGLCGTIVSQKEGFCQIRLTTQVIMRADAKGLVHGGFVFGMADYAAMCAVNHPHVVLGASEIRFLKPVVAGDTLDAFAEVKEADQKKREVKVTVRRREECVFEGHFTCFVLPGHVLEL